MVVFLVNGFVSTPWWTHKESREATLSLKLPTNLTALAFGPSDVTPMTTTTTCAVPWCTECRKLGDDEARHAASILLSFPPEPEGPDGRRIEVRAEVWDRNVDPGSSAVVYFNDLVDGELYSAA